MKPAFLLTIHILVALAKILQPGGIKAIIAENLLLKHQLAILGRSRQKAPNLKTTDRFILGGLSLFISARRRLSVSVTIQPSTPLMFHRALVKRKYRRLFSNKGHRRPGPKGPSRELINAIIELKQRNPRYGCPRIAYIIDLFRCESLTLKSYWILVVMDQWSRPIIGFGIHLGPVDGVAVCRMFNQIVSGSEPPAYLGSDNDPLFQFHQWKANLRILDVSKIKSIPYVPMSHPFVERVIGTIRREYLDQVPFWNSLDLERKLREFKDYYNNHRTHAALSGQSPSRYCEQSTQTAANLNNYVWQQHCREMFQTPISV